MGNDALTKMAQDMQIKRYRGESQTNYTGRVVYSALCQWMRFSVMDETTQKIDCKSKAYILSRIRELLYVMSSAFPSCKHWIFGDLRNPNDANEVVRDLRDKMLAARELIEVDDMHNIGIPSYEKIPCFKDYNRIIGLIEDSCIAKYVGITRVVRAELETENCCVLHEICIDDYVDWIFKTVAWNECINFEGFEFFNPYSKKPPYQSWSNVISKNDEVFLARLTLYNGLHEYHLIKKQKEKFFNAPLTDLLSEWKEERRILLALRKVAGNPMKATYEMKDSVYILNLYCGLPIREQTIIDTYCWPLNSIEDKYNFVVPDFVWTDVKKLLVDNLGIILEEKK